jgi:tetratricopeptide (TPR) repeat protein
MTNWDDAERRVEKAQEFFERERWEDAVHELKAAIAINPYNGAWYFDLGLTLDMMERYDEAIAAYRRALEIEPDDIEVLNAIGIDCTRSGKFDEAIQFFERIEALDSSFEPCYCNRIIAHAELGQHDLAEEMFFTARQYKEKCPVCFYNMGNSLFTRGLYDRAIWCWQQTIELEPEHPQTHARIAEAFWAKGQLPQAREHFVLELRANPGDIDTLLDLGQLLIELGDHASAAEKFRQTLELSPDETTAHYQLGVLAMTKGDIATALQQFRRVLRNDRHFPGVHLRLAQIHRQQKDVAEALFHANSELAQKQFDEAILLELGGLLMDLHQLAGAQEAFRRVLSDRPQHAAARLNLAVVLLLDHRLDEGIEQCKLALRAQPKYMLAMHNLALAYATKRDLTRATFWLREAMDIAPHDNQLRALQNRLRMLSVLQRVISIGRLFGRRRSNP